MKVTATLAIAILAASAADSCSNKPDSAQPSDGASASASSSPTGPVTCPPGTALKGGTPPEAHRIWCATEDGISHGPYLAWFDDGQKKTEGSFRNGNAHGKWKHWHQTGAVRTEGEYKDGEKSGDWPEFDPEGRPLHERRPWDRKEAKREEKKAYAYESKRDAKVPSETGIIECDHYIFYYSRCIEDHAPEATKAQLAEAMRRTVEGWKSVSKSRRGALASTCKAALDAVKKTSAAWGCEF